MSALPPDHPFLNGLIKNAGNPCVARWRMSGIPDKLRTTRFEKLDTRNNTALDTCRYFAQQAAQHDIEQPEATHFLSEWEQATQSDTERFSGLLLTGSTGTGKSTLAVAALREYVRATNGQMPIAYWEAAAGLEAIRRSYGDEGEHVESMTEIAQRVRVLVLDDLGAHKINDWVRDQFYQLIHALYADRVHLIVTTNLTSDELVEAIGRPSASRIWEMCLPIAVDGIDRRYEKHAKYTQKGVA